MERILIGGTYSDGVVVNPTYILDDADVRNVRATMSSAIIGDQIAVDEFVPTASNWQYTISTRFIPSDAQALITSDGLAFRALGQERRYYDAIPYGTPVWWYVDNALQGKFYVASARRVAKYDYEIDCISAVGILDGLKHYGGIYTGQTFDVVVAGIIGNAIEYTVDDSVADIKVIGWLPIATKRENLHQLLFACGVNITKGADGNVVFSKLSDAVSVTVPDNRIFYAGEVRYTSPANRVEITEHTFEKLPTDESVVLFDNTDGSGTANATIISFADPMHDISADGSLTILESGVNYAKVSGVGILRGLKYTHTTHIIAEETQTNAAPKTVSVTDATLVSVLNSLNVARRVLAYHSSARTIRSDIVVNGEKPSNIVSFNNPYNEPETAFMASMEINATSFLRASCELVADYTPTGEGNNFNNAVLLTGSGTWTKPDGTTRVRAVLIGGGQGGQSGGDGESGKYGSTSSNGDGGNGGIGGQGGKGGKIFLVDTSSLGSSVAYSCGVGGDGGVSTGTTPTDGADGGNTVFGAYSSEDGTHAEAGIPNILTGEIYGLFGSAGYKGGKGNLNGEELTYNGQTWYTGANGQSEKDGDAAAGGGGGGGACVGYNGNNGHDGSVVHNPDGTWHGNGGLGGTGASPDARSNATQYGCGGDGGHGGGGGGGSGGAYGSAGGWALNAGAGGTGGTGGRGGDGCIIIYY